MNFFTVTNQHNCLLMLSNKSIHLILSPDLDPVTLDFNTMTLTSNTLTPDNLLHL